jgi:hypothetical protein
VVVLLRAAARPALERLAVTIKFSKAPARLIG